jgi:FkbM family methyltransferase
MKRINFIIKILAAYFVRLNFNINSSEFKKIYKKSFVHFFNDTLSKEISIFGVYEKEQLNKIINIMKSKKKRVFLDIGANIGNHSIFFSNFFEKVISFEPHPKTFQLLKINAGNIKNIQIFNIALTEKKKIVYLRDFPSTNMGGHSLHKNGEFKSQGNRLDNIIDSKKIDLIKIDTEGHEYRVLKGMKKLLTNNNPILMYELDAKNYTENDVTVKYLKKLNYKYFYFFDQDFDYYKYRIRNLIFLFIKIVFFGVGSNKIYLKKITQFKNQKNYFINTLVCSKCEL